MHKGTLMPITLFHLGPGVALKSLAQKNMSFTVFAFTQVVIDLESVYFLVQNEWSVHRFFHSYVGATVVAVIGVAIGRPICQWFLRIWNARLSQKQKEWCYVEPVISKKSAIIGSVLGAYSHVLLDSIKHSDMTPFSPFVEGNAMLEAIGILQLHIFCVVAGVVGTSTLVVHGFFTRKRHDKSFECKQSGRPLID